MGAPTLQPFLASNNPFYAKQQSRKNARNPLWNRYQANDKWLFLCAENTDENWSKLCGTLDAPDLGSDSRFASPNGRAENHVALVEALGSAIAKKSAQEWLDRWQRAGLVASPIQNLKELSEDPQAWENDYLMKTHCSEVDREVEIRGLPVTLSKTPGSVETLGPELGQDTEILLREVLEMEWDRIEELKAEGVIP